jgi:hypothetical protein
MHQVQECIILIYERVEYTKCGYITVQESRLTLVRETA